jgi:C-5 cytosine-specific DNA methylase
VYQYWNGEQVTDTLTARNAGGAQRMPDKQNFNCVVGFHLPQDTITDENKTACPSAGSSTGEASLGVCEGQSQAQYIVRRLTPLECERLQGFPDGWTDIGEWTDSKGKVHKESTDSARYKALGNSIAIPPWTYVLQRLSLCCGAKPTMASLFDGIGGFPYIWESLNGKGSCVWASEIEDFPIAVTKYHFPEEVNDDG